MRRCLIGIVALIFLVGCGSSTPSAEALAKQACQKSPPGTKAELSPGQSIAKAKAGWRKVRLRWVSAGALADRAADSDASWRGLSDAYATYVELADFFISLSLNPNSVTPPQQAHYDALVPRVVNAQSTQRAKCNALGV
jgi:hypothetical protein